MKTTSLLKSHSHHCPHRQLVPPQFRHIFSPAYRIPFPIYRPSRQSIGITFSYPEGIDFADAIPATAPHPHPSLPSSSTDSPPDPRTSLSSNSFSSLDEEDPFLQASPEPAAALAPSPELRELCYLQLGMLITTLESRHLDTRDVTIKCAVYRRSPASLPSGQLQLQLVADSDIPTPSSSSSTSSSGATTPTNSAAAASSNGTPTNSSQQGEEPRRKDLILGIPGTDEQYQEALILEQLIVLPDSGGLVLPLSHNSFLVGLLVVECCAPSSNFLHPPACAMFSPADVALIKQTGTALALSCALDLRAGLERAGHAVRRRQVQGLVRQARKPLNTLRTLGAMLVPRLQVGEPERDLTESIVAQGQRLGEIVGQLQAFLAPSMPAVRIGSLMAPGTGVQRNNNNNGNDSEAMFSTSATTSTTMPTQHPALPSSSIGGDFGGLMSLRGGGNQQQQQNSTAYISVDMDDATTRRRGDENAEKNSSSSLSISSPPSPPPPTATAPLLATLAPMLSGAQNFASVSGVTYIFPPSMFSSSTNRTRSTNTNGRRAATMEPNLGTSTTASTTTISDDREDEEEIMVPVDTVTLKRLLCQLLDGPMACAARGDCIELMLDRHEQWQGRQGVIIATRVTQAIGPGVLTRGVAPAMDTAADGHVFLSEFATLSRLARQVGGWLDVKVRTSESNGEVENSSSDGDVVDDPTVLVAALWLPTVSPIT